LVEKGRASHTLLEEIGKREEIGGPEQRGTLLVLKLHQREENILRKRGLSLLLAGEVYKRFVRKGGGRVRY